MPNITIGGDLRPQGRNGALFAAGEVELLFHDLLDEFESADLTIANLECPLVERPSPTPEYGPHLAARTECVRGLARAQIDVVGLANNHILDHGDQGLDNTIEACKKEGIRIVGAGRNVLEARRPLRLQIDHTRLGVMALTEHEFSVATENSAGATRLI